MVSQYLVITLSKFCVKQVTKLFCAPSVHSWCLSMSSFVVELFFMARGTAYNNNGCNFLPGFSIGFWFRGTLRPKTV